MVAAVGTPSVVEGRVLGLGAAHGAAQEAGDLRVELLGEYRSLLAEVTTGTHISIV
jgi:hypothetical protein